MKPRICMVIPVYHPSLGGLGRQAQMITERLADAGIEVFVLARKMKGVPSCSYSPQVKIYWVWTPWPSVPVLEKMNFQMKL